MGSLSRVGVEDTDRRACDAFAMADPSQVPERLRPLLGWRNDPDRPSAPVPVRTIVVTIGLVLATLLTLLLVWELRRILELLVISGLFAIMLNPAVDRVQRLGLRRGLATTIVFLVGVAIVAGLGYLFARPIYTAARRFADDFPSTVRDLKNGHGRLGHLVKQYHIDRWVSENTPKIRDAFAHAARPAADIAKRLLNGVISLVTVMVLTFMLLLEAPGMTKSVLAVVPPRRAERLRRIGADVGRSVTGYVAGNMATSIIAGIIVFVTLTILGVPFASLFGVWVALVDLLPLVGGLLAGVPTVIVAFVHSTTAGIVTAIVFLVYQQVENHALNPAIMSKTVRLNPLWVFLSVLVGVELAGFVGALLAIPFAGAIQVVARDVWDERRGRPKPVPTVGEDERPTAGDDGG